MIFVISERLQIIRNKTLFTYRSTIKIHHVQKSDAQDYICTGNYKSSENTILSEYAIYKLVVNGNYNISTFFNEKFPSI